MSSEPEHDSAMTEAQRRRALKRLLAVVAAMGLIGAAAVTFVSWGGPRLGQGGMVVLGDGMTWANDGVENTRMLVRPTRVGTVSATFSISNEGHLPFTVYGIDGMYDGTWFSKQRVTFEPGLGLGKKPSSQLTLRPGDQATVHWSLDITCVPIMSEGGSVSIDTLGFKMRWWGGTTARDLLLEQPITFMGDSTTSTATGADCT